MKKLCHAFFLLLAYDLNYILCMNSSSSGNINNKSCSRVFSHDFYESKVM
jgi:hypothetical protein